jgi:hypothetical protein
VWDQESVVVLRPLEWGAHDGEVPLLVAL